MKEIVEFIAKSIVNAPADVVVTEESSERGVLIKLQVANEDKGRVIGKQGKVAGSHENAASCCRSKGWYQGNPGNRLARISSSGNKSTPLVMPGGAKIRPIFVN